MEYDRMAMVYREVDYVTEFPESCPGVCITCMNTAARSATPEKKYGGEGGNFPLIHGTSLFGRW